MKVDRRGIEPLFPPCEGGALPLHQQPIVVERGNLPYPSRGDPDWSPFRCIRHNNRTRIQHVGLSEERNYSPL